jgi:DNA polymerase-3 subunit epsilon
MFAVIDFETTDVTDSRRATEVGIVILDSDLKEVAVYESLVNPERKAFRGSLGHSLLVQSELDAAPTFEQLWPAIAELISGKFLVMHNEDFDKGVLLNELDAMGLNRKIGPSLCTMKAAGRVFPERKAKGERELSTLIEFLGLPAGTAHQALADARMTAELFRHIFPLDREMQSTVQVLADDLVEYEVIGKAFEPVTRKRISVGGVSDEELRKIAEEIEGNTKVLLASHACRTGSLADQPAFEEALASIGFTLEDKETTASTAFLVHGSKAGVRKVNKAKDYGRPVLSEDDALRLIELLKG